jgi:hypothetical protein
METRDNEDNLIAEGPIGVIRMTEMSVFNTMDIAQTNGINGALADYTISITTATPANDGDIFNLLLP